jgi:hypothetical protein
VVVLVVLLLFTPALRTCRSAVLAAVVWPRWPACSSRELLLRLWRINRVETVTACRHLWRDHR